MPRPLRLLLSPWNAPVSPSVGQISTSLVSGTRDTCGWRRSRVAVIGCRVPAHPARGGYARYRVGQRPGIGQEITDWCRGADIVKVLVLSAPVDPPLYVERE